MRHRYQNFLLVLFSFSAIAAIEPLAAPSATAGLIPGDILVNTFLGSGPEQEYSPSGTLVQSFDDPNHSEFIGGTVAVTPNGSLISGFYAPAAGVDLFNSTGALTSSFNTPAVTTPGQISAFADGTLAIPDQNNPDVSFYSQAGSLLGTYPVPGANQFLGSTVGPDNTLWLTSIFNDTIYHLNSAGTVLGSITTPFSPSGVVISHDGADIFATDRDSNEVYELSTTGTVLNSFMTDVTIGQQANFEGIAEAGDGSLYVLSFESPAYYHYSTAGTLLDSTAISPNSGPFTLSIVPNSVPEPTTTALGLISSLALLSRRSKQHAVLPHNS